MNEQMFKTMFISNFLSTWCATQYDEVCANGKHEIFDHPPVEDAEHLAEKAWLEWKDKFPRVVNLSTGSKKL